MKVAVEIIMESKISLLKSEQSNIPTNSPLSHLINPTNTMRSSHRQNALLGLLLPTIIIKEVMSTQEVGFRLDELFRSKKISIKQVIELLGLLTKCQNMIVLSQRIAMLATIMNFVFLSTRQYKEEIERFRHEICFDPLNRETHKKKNKHTSAKRITTTLADRKGNLTIKEMLVRAVQQGLNQVDLSIHNMTPMREPIMAEMSAYSFVPPFEAKIIEQLSQDQSVISKEAPNTLNQALTKEKMMTYHKLLEIGPFMENDEKQPTLERTFVQRQKKTVKKRKTLARDEEIELGQFLGKQNDIEMLTTKAKAGRQVSKQIQFQKKFEQCNSLLTDISSIISKLDRKFKKNPFKANSSYQGDLMGSNMVQINSLIEQRRSIYQQQFVVNEENNPSITSALQSKLTNVLQGQLFIQQSVGFHSFCEKRAIYRDIKCELFYQLLQMNFPLSQDSPSTFGQISIHRIPSQ